MASSESDRIEKSIFLKAPRSKVWNALTSAEQFGKWFGANLQGEFAPGSTVSGRITIPNYDHLTIEMVIERVEPERLLAYRWHPHAVDINMDYTSEPMTLVEFTLTDASGGTTLTVVESGFDRLPPARRLEAFRMNSDGWADELRNIERHVTQT